jgi:Small metal-binding protein
MQFSVRFATVLVLTMSIILPLQSVFSSGIARRDAVRSEEQHRQEAVRLAKEAADHGKQGYGGLFLSNAEAALQHAFKAGKDVHVDAGIAELKQALE